jgi:hypothetical protein
MSNSSLVDAVRRIEKAHKHFKGDERIDEMVDDLCCFLNECDLELDEISAEYSKEEEEEDDE